MHDFAVGHDQLFGVIGARQVVDQRLVDHFGRSRALLRLNGGDRPVGVVAYVVKRRHVDAGNLRRHAQIFLARQAGSLPLPVNVDGLVGGNFAVAEHEQIDKRRQRLRIEGARAAADDKRARGAVGAAQRYTGKIERLEYVAEAHLVLERDAQKVKLPHGRTALQREQRHVLFAHQRRHVHPRRKDALAKGVVARVDGVIQYLHAQVGHADFVGIGKKEGIAHIHRSRVFYDAAVLAAHVAHGFFDALKQPVDPFRKVQGHTSTHKHLTYLL